LRVFMRIVNNCTLLLVFFEIFFLSDRRVWRLLYIVPTTEPSRAAMTMSNYPDDIYIQKNGSILFPFDDECRSEIRLFYEMTIRNKVIVLIQR